METFDFNNVYRCKECPFITTDSWVCELHKKISHDMLITEKSKMLIMTILDTLINPTTMKNVTIVIDDKHEYLSSTKSHRRKRKSDSGSFDHVSPVKQRIIGQSQITPDHAQVTQNSEVTHEQAIRGIESLPIQIIESKSGGYKKVSRIGVPFPNDPFKFIPQAEKDLLDSYSRKNHQITKINAEVYNLINNEMQRGKIVCRNTVESFVNKQDWTLNGKIFEFTFEWFERFSELYNIYPVKGVPIRSVVNYALCFKKITNFDLIDKPIFKRKKVCLWQKEEENDSGKNLVNCKIHVSRPCSNRACSKWACAEYHSVSICSKCAHNMPFICENINYQKPKMETDERQS